LIGQAAAADFMVGETRACLSGDPSEQLRVTIGRVEPYGKGLTVVHVSLFNKAPAAAFSGIAHAPVEAQVLAKSCPTVEAEVIPLSPMFETGYGQWREAKGGIFTIPIDQIYEIYVGQVVKARQGGLNVQ
jgi:hypothetical protein